MDTDIRPSNPERWSSQEMMDWLQKLDESNMNITNWEAEFLESQAKRNWQPNLSPKQRECVVRMANKYKLVR